MGRKNNGGGTPQARRRQDGSAFKAKRTPAPPVEALIVPVGRCFYRSRNGKLRYTADQVDGALQQAQRKRDRAGSAHREERHYRCDQPGGCGDFHLTSRDSYTERGQA